MLSWALPLSASPVIAHTLASTLFAVTLYAAATLYYVGVLRGEFMTRLATRLPCHVVVSVADFVLGIIDVCPVRQVPEIVMARHIVQMPHDATSDQERPSHKNVYAYRVSTPFAVELDTPVSLRGYRSTQRNTFAQMISPAIARHTIYGSHVPIVADLIPREFGNISPRCHKDMVVDNGVVR